MASGVQHEGPGILTGFGRDGYKAFSVTVFATGLLLHVFLATRSWIGGDQVHLLSLGLDFSVSGIIHPFAKMMTGAGGNPGALLQFLIGIPLAVFPHFQSPMIVVVLMHVCAGWLLASIFRKDFGEGSAAFFMVVYWLSPWRLYNGGFLWEPSYVFLPAALHFWSCWRLKDGPAFWPSCILAVSLVTSAQIHNSAFLLLCVTLALFIKRSLRIRWSGFVAGTVAASLTLVPTLLYFAGDAAATARESQGFVGESLLKVYPVFKGALYWFTLGGLDAVRPLNETVFLQGAASGLWVRFLQVLCILTVGVSLVSSWWFFKPVWRPGAGEDRRLSWWRTYAVWMFVSLVVASALSPIVLQGWQVVIALHAAVIPVILWAGKKWYRGSGAQRLAILGYVVLQIAIIITIGYGHPIFGIPGTIPEDMRHNEELVKIIPLK